MKNTGPYIYGCVYVYNTAKVIFCKIYRNDKLNELELSAYRNSDAIVTEDYMRRAVKYILIYELR